MKTLEIKSGENMRKQTPMVWPCEAREWRKFCEMVSEADRASNKEERTTEKAMDGLC
jgi:hypothetical protein